jgi:hypothetical protein
VNQPLEICVFFVLIQYNRDPGESTYSYIYLLYPNFFSTLHIQYVLLHVKIWYVFYLFSIFN